MHAHAYEERSARGCMGRERGKDRREGECEEGMLWFVRGVGGPLTLLYFHVHCRFPDSEDAEVVRFVTVRAYPSVRSTVLLYDLLDQGAASGRGREQLDSLTL